MLKVLLSMMIVTMIAAGCQVANHYQFERNLGDEVSDSLKDSPEESDIQTEETANIIQELEVSQDENGMYVIELAEESM